MILKFISGLLLVILFLISIVLNFEKLHFDAFPLVIGLGIVGFLAHCVKIFMSAGSAVENQSTPTFSVSASRTIPLDLVFGERSIVPKIKLPSEERLRNEILGEEEPDIDSEE